LGTPAQKSDKDRRVPQRQPVLNRLIAENKPVGIDSKPANTTQQNPQLASLAGAATV
jgi:hypothetical protein